MSLFTPTYGGAPIFGQAVKMEHLGHPCAQQVEAFFGVGGTFSVFGGARGRLFQVQGILIAADFPTLNAFEDLFLSGITNSYADGVVRVLFDTRGRSWANVVYYGEYQPEPGYPKPGVYAGGFGYIQPYKAIFHGLT